MIQLKTYLSYKAHLTKASVSTNYKNQFLKVN